MQGTRMSPTKRQQYILTQLKSANKPLTGKHLAELTRVSRQVIVQDISILKAKNEPIVATSQGYIYIQEQAATVQHIIAVNHSPKDTKKELYTIVDHGVTVKNVIVEHPVYGELTASIMVSSRSDVDQFLKRVKETNASYLSTLTDGIHLHTLEAATMDKIKAACKALKRENILLNS